MGRVVLDSSVVLALFDTRDAHHAVAAEVVRQHRRVRSPFIIPASVFSEVLVGAHRQGHETVALRRRQMRDSFGPPRPIDEDVAVAAADLRSRHPALRLADAFVVAVAMVDRAHEMLTADKRLAKVDERVRVVG
jgi:predicted nucleic acid-binding protein